MGKGGQNILFIYLFILPGIKPVPLSVPSGTKDFGKLPTSFFPPWFCLVKGTEME